MSDNDKRPTAYRGYLYTPRLVGGGGDVSKDGAHICYAPSLAVALKTIDLLLDQGNATGGPGGERVSAGMGKDASGPDRPH